MHLIEECKLRVWNRTPIGYSTLFDDKSPIVKLKDKFRFIPFQIDQPGDSELDLVSKQLLEVLECRG